MSFSLAFKYWVITPKVVLINLSINQWWLHKKLRQNRLVSLDRLIARIITATKKEVNRDLVNITGVLMGYVSYVRWWKCFDILKWTFSTYTNRSCMPVEFAHYLLPHCHLQYRVDSFLRRAFNDSKFETQSKPFQLFMCNTMRDMAMTVPNLI